MNDAMMQHNDVQNAHGVLSKKEERSDSKEIKKYETRERDKTRVLAGQADRCWNPLEGQACGEGWFSLQRFKSWFFMG